MTILIEDSPRNNVVKWTIEAHDAGVVDGVVFSPFTTSPVASNFKRDCEDCVGRLRDDGIEEIWFDPATHALQMPTVGDFRYYDDRDLWDGVRGDVGTGANQREHVRRVFAAQRKLGVPLLGPTVHLDNPTSQASQQALSLARIAIELADGDDVWLTVAGSTTFWRAGAALDAHVGGVAQLDAAGYFVVQARPNTALPVQTHPEEVHGLCRTVRSLSEIGLVHVSHGDLAGLPAIAAGATSLGTGWDTRQRVCAYASYAQRPPAGDGGGWLQRPTIEELCAVLSRQEAELLRNQDAALCDRLVPGPLPPAGAPQESFNHHAARLQSLVDRVADDLYDVSFQNLRDVYAAALAEWPGVSAIVHPASDEGAWIAPLNEGLARYGRTEGWLP